MCRVRMPIKRMLDGLAKRLVGFIFEEAATVRHLPKNVIQARYHQNTDNRTHQHATGAGGTNGPVSDGSGTLRDDQRKQAGNESE